MILDFVSHPAAKLSPSMPWKTKEITSIFYDSNNTSKKLDAKDRFLLLKPSEQLKHLVNKYNNMLSRADDINPDGLENTVSSKYYDIEELQNLKITNKSKSLSVFHINTCSLNKNLDDLHHPLSCANKNFDIIAINETIIAKNVFITKQSKH